MPRSSIKFNAAIARRVQEMAGYGVPQGGIANLVGLSPKTLRRLYKHELEIGMAQADAAICRKLYEVALGGDRAALLFSCKARFKWREDDDRKEQQRSQRLAIVAALREAFNSVG